MIKVYPTGLNSNVKDVKNYQVMQQNPLTYKRDCFGKIDNVSFGSYEETYRCDVYNIENAFWDLGSELRETPITGDSPEKVFSDFYDRLEKTLMTEPGPEVDRDIPLNKQEYTKTLSALVRHYGTANPILETDEERKFVAKKFLSQHVSWFQSPKFRIFTSYTEAEIKSMNAINMLNYTFDLFHSKVFIIRSLK